MNSDFDNFLNEQFEYLDSILLSIYGLVLGIDEEKDIFFDRGYAIAHIVHVYCEMFYDTVEYKSSQMHCINIENELLNARTLTSLIMEEVKSNSEHTSLKKILGVLTDCAMFFDKVVDKYTNNLEVVNNIRDYLNKLYFRLIRRVRNRYILEDDTEGLKLSSYVIHQVENSIPAFYTSITGKQLMNHLL